MRRFSLLLLVGALVLMLATVHAQNAGDVEEDLQLGQQEVDPDDPFDNEEIPEDIEQQEEEEEVEEGANEEIPENINAEDDDGVFANEEEAAVQPRPDNDVVLGGAADNLLNEDEDGFPEGFQFGPEKDIALSDEEDANEESDDDETSIKVEHKLKTKVAAVDVDSSCQFTFGDKNKNVNGLSKVKRDGKKVSFRVPSTPDVDEEYKISFPSKDAAKAFVSKLEQCGSVAEPQPVVDDDVFPEAEEQELQLQDQPQARLEEEEEPQLGGPEEEEEEEEFNDEAGSAPALGAGNGIENAEDVDFEAQEFDEDAFLESGASARSKLKGMMARLRRVPRKLRN